MDKQLRNNFSVMFQAISDKIDSVSFQEVDSSVQQTTVPPQKANQQSSAAAAGLPSTQNSKNAQATQQKSAPKSVPSGTKDQAKTGEEEDEEYYEYYEEDEDEV